jgi:hypothetical protein
MRILEGRPRSPQTGWFRGPESILDRYAGADATALRAGAGSEISLTMRMRETAPPASGMPRREYPPPAAGRRGLDKIWQEIDRELGPRRGKP